MRHTAEEKNYELEGKCTESRLKHWDPQKENWEVQRW